MRRTSTDACSAGIEFPDGTIDDALKFCLRLVAMLVVDSRLLIVDVDVDVDRGDGIASKAVSRDFLHVHSRDHRPFT